MPDDIQGGGAKRWWQWFLLYPTFGVAVISASPGLADKALAVYHQTGTATYSDAIRQSEMWVKNAECSQGPVAWYSNPSRVKVDATMCPSGDLFVRAVTPDDRISYHWVPLDEVIAPPEPQGGGLIRAARAAPAPVGPATAPVRLAMLQSGAVICQRALDGKTLIRRIRTPQGCFDEYVNLFTGAVVDRKPAPCVPQC
ncbi:MAG TPA: hypothetical protein VFZ91_05390 [Allosphingosinicella sp.]